MNTEIMDEILLKAEVLTREEQSRLIAILSQKAGQAQAENQGTKLKWSDLAGMAAYPMCGEDAQAYVSRTRGESDESRKKIHTH